MKVGVEEEFLVVDPETLWITPGAFRLATGLVYTDGVYVSKCSVELPLNSGSLSRLLSRLREAFCIIEVKTDPYEDIDTLREELSTHRRRLAECALENHLWVLPCGLHPGHRSSDLIDNCAALHVHLDYSKDRFDRLFDVVPFLLSISVNSPFLDGQVQAMSNRMIVSPHVNLPRGGYERSADLIYNPGLQTVEVKVCDEQITLDESIGLVSMIQAIGEHPRRRTPLSNQEYKRMRRQAILTGAGKNHEYIDEGLLQIVSEYNEYTKRKLAMIPGALWQLEVLKNYGLSGVVRSLACSFEKDERVMIASNTMVNPHIRSRRDLWYVAPYLPFFMVDKYRKYHQDIKTSGGLCNKNR